MAKRIISVIAGVVTGLIFIFIGDSVCMRLHEPPIGLNPMDQENFSNYARSIPMYVLVIMFIFWMLSTFFGGMISGLINKTGWKRSSLITGSVLLAASVLNMINVPHPTWMVIAAVVLYIPVAYLGAMIVARKKTN